MEPRKAASLMWMYLVALGVAGVLIATGAYRARVDGGWELISAGGLALAAVAVAWPISAQLRAARSASAEPFAPLIERLEQVISKLDVISEQQLLSDRAKLVAFRDKDRDAMRRAIQEEINRQDWDAALALAEDIETEFGYKGEAARFRDEIRQKRQETVRKQIQEVVSVIDRHTRSEQWNGALREADRLMGMFPDNEQVKSLPQEIDARRQAHKKQLQDNWHEAVSRHDIDGSIEILKQLDTYLTPAEAEGLQETARQVFKEKLNMMGKQFADAVRDHKWTDAIKVGDQVIRDFPNARIAQEVREKMDVLKQRAAEPQTITATPASASPVIPATVGA